MEQMRWQAFIDPERCYVVGSEACPPLKKDGRDVTIYQNRWLINALAYINKLSYLSKMCRIEEYIET